MSVHHASFVDKISSKKRWPINDVDKLAEHAGWQCGSVA
jgi:hypothetical protein